MIIWKILKLDKENYLMKVYLNHSDKISYLAAGGPHSSSVDFKNIDKKDIPIAIKRVMDVIVLYQILKSDWNDFVVRELLDI